VCTDTVLCGGNTALVVSRPVSTGETVGDYLTQWLAHAKTNVAPQTYRRYKQIVEGELAPAFGMTKLVDISPLQIELFLAKCLGRKCKNRERDLSPRTVGHFYQVLRRALNQAARWQLIPRNPCDLVDSPRISPAEMHALDEDGLRALLAAVRGTRLHMPTLLAAVSGMRRGELLALRWSDVDLDTGECQVVRALQEVPGGVSFKTPKTNKGRRGAPAPSCSGGTQSPSRDPELGEAAHGCRICGRGLDPSSGGWHSLATVAVLL